MLRRRGRLEQVFRLAWGRAKGKVFPDRRAEKKSLLGDHADVAPQHGQWIVAHSATVDQKRAFRRFVEPSDEVNQGGLAGNR